VPRLTAAAPAAPPAPHQIVPTAVYTLAAARAALGLRETSLKREIRSRRLVCSKRCGRYYLLGEHLLAWLREGEIGPRSAAGGGEKKEPPHSGVVRGGGES
jgi:hypothetical protein